jgi:SAM-dependent methyltransferase
MTMAVSQLTFDYTQIGGLDWFQWRALLWDVLPGADADEPGFWDRTAERIGALCPESSGHCGADYQRAYQALRTSGYVTGGTLDAGRGMRIWSDTLYGQAPSLLGVRPLFMNLGYSNLDGNSIPLDAFDEPFRLNIQLYERALRGVNLAGKRVLEIGCGFGAGSEYMARRHAAVVTGVDVLPHHIEACREQFSTAGLAFEVADAQDLPFAGERFDIAVSVESSGHYGSPRRFLAEALRVLAPGGRLLLADLRPIDLGWGPGRRLEDLRADIEAAGFRIAESEDLSTGVRASLDAQEQARVGLLESRTLGGTVLSHLHEIMLMKESRNRDRLDRGKLQYWRFNCVKTPAQQ